MSGFPLATPRSAVTRIKDSPGLNGRTDFDRQNAYHFTNTVTADLGDLTFISISGFDTYTSNTVTSALHSNPEPLWSEFIDDFKQGSQEFRLLSPTEQTFEWIVGLYADYSYQRLDNIYRYQGFPTPAFVGQTTSYFKQNAYTYSAYATGTWHVTDDLSLILGVRGTQTHKKGGFIVMRDFGTVVTPDKNYLATISEGAFDPSATLQYKFTPDVMVYAGWSKGSKSGSFQGGNRGAALADFAVRPEVSNNFEVGVKSQLWGWLTVNATGFYLNFKNLQTGQYVGLPPVLKNTNAGEAESKGVELVMNAALDQWIEGLTFGLTGSYIDARYIDYAGATCTAASELAANGRCINGFYTMGPQTGQPFNAAGLPLRYLPAWQGTASFNYTRSILDELKLEVNLSADMQSSYIMDTGAYDPLYGRQNGNTKLHFRLAVGDQNDAWSVAVIGRNVNDVLTTSPGAIPIVSRRIYGIDEGRSISIQGTIKVN